MYLGNEFIMIGQVGPAVNAAVGPVAGGQIRLESLGSRHLHHRCCGAWGELWGGPRGAPAGRVAGETPEDAGKGRGLAGGGCGAGSTRWRCLQRKGPPAEVWGRLSAACRAERRGTASADGAGLPAKQAEANGHQEGDIYWTNDHPVSCTVSRCLVKEKETTGNPRFQNCCFSGVWRSRQSLGAPHRHQQTGTATVRGSPGTGQA